MTALPKCSNCGNFIIPRELSIEEKFLNLYTKTTLCSSCRQKACENMDIASIEEEEQDSECSI